MNHIQQIADKLTDHDLDAMLITSEPGEFYAIGFHGEGVVVVTKEQSYYYTDPRYIEAAQKQVTQAEVSLPDKGSNYRQMVQKIIDTHGIEKLGFEEQYMTVADHQLYGESLTVAMVGATALLNQLRQSKDDEEITAMVQAQDIAEEALEEILQFIQVGVTEKEIAAKLQYEMLRRGAEKMSFDPIVASGPNGSLPHAVPTDRKIREGDFITLDFGCKFGGYCSDMTRTIAVGEPTEEMKKVYNTVLDAQMAGIAAAKAGATGKDVHMAAQKIIEEAGYGQYFGHGFGHSLGIEIHEAPNASPRNPNPLPLGAVISAEPGIYLPGRFGVRIEDALVLVEDGNINITKAPKALIIL